MPWPTITKRVRFSGWSSMSRARISSPACFAPCAVPIEAIPARFDFATCCAASAVELATIGTASGRFLASQIRVWPSGLGCDTTVVMSASFVPGRAHRFSETGRSTSRCTRSSVSNARVSSVTGIEPSIEFSMGTMPRSTSPCSTALITCGTSRNGTATPAARSGCVRSASSANVPRGPRKPRVFVTASASSKW